MPMRREPLHQQLGDASFLGLAHRADPGPPGGIGRPCGGLGWAGATKQKRPGAVRLRGAR